MEPKEKALELIDKMYNTEHCGIDHFPNKKYCNCSEINIYQAKQCAIVAVNEILRLYKENWNIDNSFWNQVKIELNNL